MRSCTTGGATACMSITPAATGRKALPPIWPITCCRNRKAAAPSTGAARLQKYADFVTASRDFPLAQFTSRHSEQSEAVGYGKAMMMFHMLRRQLCDDTFMRALREFYRDYRFKVAGFADLERAFSQASGKDLQPLPFFTMGATDRRAELSLDLRAGAPFRGGI